MTPSIEVDDEIYALLRENAEPFTDTPATVLRRLLKLGGSSTADPQAHTPVETTADIGPASGEQRVEPRSPRSRKKGARAARGSLLPEAAYEIPILRYLAQSGGRAPSREVIEGVGGALAGDFTDTDQEELRSGEVRWKSRVAFVRLRLVEKGDLDGTAPRGTWAITDQGRNRLSSLPK